MLRRLENHDRKERVNVSEYTIEHILPQNTNLNHDWREALGPDWEKSSKNMSIHLEISRLPVTTPNIAINSLPIKGI